MDTVISAAVVVSAYLIGAIPFGLLIILCGINYDKTSKEHSCRIERI